MEKLNEVERKVVKASFDRDAFILDILSFPANYYTPEELLEMHDDTLMTLWVRFAPSHATV